MEAEKKFPLLSLVSKKAAREPPVTVMNRTRTDAPTIIGRPIGGRCLPRGIPPYLGLDPRVVPFESSVSDHQNAIDRTVTPVLTLGCEKGVLGPIAVFLL